MEYSLCRIAIKNIHDELLLKEIVIYDYNQAMGIEALKNIYNQEFLIDVVLNNYDVHYKFTGFETIKLTKQIAVGDGQKFSVEIETLSVPLIVDSRGYYDK